MNTSLDQKDEASVVVMSSKRLRAELGGGPSSNSMPRYLGSKWFVLRFPDGARN